MSYDLTEILQIACRDGWEGAVPSVPQSVRIAVDGLNRQRRAFWENEADTEALLATNPGAKQIFGENEDPVIAFAIRTVRLLNGST